MRIDRRAAGFAGFVYLAVLLAALLPQLHLPLPAAMDWKDAAGAHRLAESQGWFGRWTREGNSTALGRAEGKVSLYFNDFVPGDASAPLSLLTVWLRDGDWADERLLRVRALAAFLPAERAFLFPADAARLEEAVLYDHAQPLQQLNCTVSGRAVLAGEGEELSTAELFARGIRLSLRGEGCGLEVEAAVLPETLAPAKGVGYALFATTVALLNWLGAVQLLRRAGENASHLDRLSLASTLLVCLQDSFAVMLHLSLALDFGGEPLFFALFLLFFVLFSLVDFHVLVGVWRVQRAREFAVLGARDVQRRACAFQAKLYLAVVGYNYVMWRAFLAPGVLLAQGATLWPQVARLATQAVSPRFDADFLLLFSAAKYLLFAYWRGCPFSFTEFRPVPAAAGLGALLLLASLGVLWLQSRRGPRFFLPRAWRNDHAYFVSQRRYAQRKGAGDDCLICLSALAEGAPGLAEPAELSPLAVSAAQRHRDEVMLAPCGHGFHPGCLLQWMERKMECPACRAALPQLY